ncbi:Ja22 [Japanese cytomegalovirus]|nr:Ja22 [Japanese cytomegalovirus]
MNNLYIVFILTYISMNKAMTDLVCNYNESQVCKEHCNETVSTVGKNVTLGIPIKNGSTVFWSREKNNVPQLLCQFSPSLVTCNSRHHIYYECLHNYSLLLINVTTQYSGIYCLSAYAPTSKNDIETCYNLTVHSQRISSSKLIPELSAKHTTSITPHTTTNVQHNKSVANYTFQAYYASNNHMPWLALPILIIILVVLCWFHMPQRYKYQPYTWAFCFYGVCTPTHLQRK